MQVVVEVVQSIREDANISNGQPEPSAGDDDDDDDAIEALLTPARARVVKFPSPQALDAANEPIHLRCLAIVRSLLERMLGVSGFPPV